MAGPRRTAGNSPVVGWGAGDDMVNSLGTSAEVQFLQDGSMVGMEPTKGRGQSTARGGPGSLPGKKRGHSRFRVREGGLKALLSSSAVPVPGRLPTTGAEPVSGCEVRCRPCRLS